MKKAITPPATSGAVPGEFGFSGILVEIEAVAAKA